MRNLGHLKDDVNYYIIMPLSETDPSGLVYIGEL